MADGCQFDLLEKKTSDIHAHAVCNMIPGESQSTTRKKVQLTHTRDISPVGLDLAVLYQSPESRDLYPRILQVQTKLLIV